MGRLKLLMLQCFVQRFGINADPVITRLLNGNDYLTVSVHWLVKRGNNSEFFQSPQLFLDLRNTDIFPDTVIYDMTISLICRHTHPSNDPSSALEISEYSVSNCFNFGYLCSDWLFFYVLAN